MYVKKRIEKLRTNGFVIISKPFLHNQKYGADLFEGPSEFINYLGCICTPFSIIQKIQNNEPESGYIGSHVVLSL